jgi:hypothetical protein
VLFGALIEDGGVRTEEGKMRGEFCPFLSKYDEGVDIWGGVGQRAQLA